MVLKDGVEVQMEAQNMALMSCKAKECFCITGKLSIPSADTRLRDGTNNDLCLLFCLPVFFSSCFLKNIHYLQGEKQRVCFQMNKFLPRGSQEVTQDG